MSIIHSKIISWHDKDGFNQAFKEASKILGDIKNIGVEGQRIRFFETHEDALMGEELVRERAGTKEEIKLDKNEAVFTEGLKDVRHCFGEAQGEGGVAGGGAGIGGHCINSKYRNYVIQGNIILLCQGMDINASFRNCEKLLNLLNEE